MKPMGAIGFVNLKLSASMSHEKLYTFELEDWDSISLQFKQLYRATFAFVLENKGSLAEAREVYLEAFLYYMQLLELKGIKLSQKGETLVYSFSRKLWLHKLEKRRVDLDFVRHRREFFEMEEAFHEIDAINLRSAKTAEKLAEIGEPCRTLLLECVGRRKELNEVISRLGFSCEIRAFASIGQCIRKLIKITESKEFNIAENRFLELMRYALDGIEPTAFVASDEEKVCLTMVSRVVAMVRNHVTRNERLDRFKQIEEKSLPQSLAGLSEMDEPYTEKSKFMKSIAVIGTAVLAAAGVAALTAFSVSEAMHHNREAEQLAIEEVVADSSAALTTAIEVVLPPRTISAFAIANGGYVVTAAAPLNGAQALKLQAKDWAEPSTAHVVAMDSINDLALLQFDENTSGLSRLPYRLLAARVALGDALYSLSFSGDALRYTGGSMSSTMVDGSAQVHMPSAIPGMPLFESSGQVAGMVLSIQDDGSQLCTVATSDRLGEWVAAQLKAQGIDQVLPTRNGLFYSKRPKQIEQLQPFVYALEITY
jgi:hypothetical protein